LVAVSDMAATDRLGMVEIGDDVELLVLDGNLAPGVVGAALELAATTQTRVVIEPVSVPKARRLAGQLRADRPVFAVTPNADELVALAGTDDPRALHDRGVELVWVRLGDRGSWLSGPGIDERLAASAADVQDVTGAGDAMTAAFCHAILRGADPVAAARYGHRAAALTVASPHTVRPDLADQLGTP
jgi:pseudouridine kinase